MWRRRIKTGMVSLMGGVDPFTMFQEMFGEGGMPGGFSFGGMGGMPEWVEWPVRDKIEVIQKLKE